MSRSEAGALGGRGNEKAVDNIKSFNGGTERSYILARLERDRPDVVRLVDGEVGALGEVGGDRRSEAVQVQGDNITLKQRGTDPTYLLARMKR